jgi:hypothetical protein
MIKTKAFKFNRTVLDMKRFQRVDVIFGQLNVSHVWKWWLRGMFRVGLRAKRACGKGAVDSQYGIGAEGSSHPCTKGYHHK